MNEIKVAKTSAVTTIDGVGAVTMPADTGRETKKILVAMETGNKANLQLCKSIARIKSTESYKEVYNKDGKNVTPTFGDFAEKVLEMSKGSASGYASVGEVFADYLDESGYKYGHFVLMLKMRKIVDENGEPLTGKEIVEMLEEHGATPELSTRKLDELIKNLLCEGDGAGDGDGDGEGDGAGDGDGDGEGDGAGDGDDDKGVVSLTTCFKIIRASATSAGKYEELNKLIVELETALGV